MSTEVNGGLLAEAATRADRAERAAGITIAELHSTAEMVEASDLLDRIWRPTKGTSLIGAAMLKVLSHCGSYVVAAVRDGRMVGACVGVLADFGLHSHITGIEDGLRGAGVGHALKLHQRSWALARGIDTVTWTFDPLISRNAYFNMTKLGAVPAEYLADYYGDMDNELNAGIPSDRLLVRWDLAGAHVVHALEARAVPEVAGAVAALDADADGGPVFGPRDARRLLIGIPRDVEALRGSAPELAAQWRLALRDVLGGCMGRGDRVTGFTRDGRYVVENTPEQESIA